MRASSPLLKALIVFHLLLITQASSNSNNPWEKYILSPSSRNPGPKAVHAIQYDNSRGITTLGVKYRGIDEVTRDSLEDFKARGWL